MATERQMELLTFIDRYQQRRGGITPSFDEMADALGLRSKSGVARLIDALEERGYIRRLRHRARALEVLRKPAPQLPGSEASALAASGRVATLSELEEKALTAAHRAMEEVMPFDDSGTHDASFARVAVALSGRCQGIEVGSYGPADPDRAGELEALQQAHFDDGFLRSSKVVGAA